MAVSLIELGRGGRMRVGQVLRMQRNGQPVTRKVPSHETGPGRDRLNRMVGVPSGLQKKLSPGVDRIPGPAYYPGEAPRQERIRRQTSPVDLYAMSEEETDPLMREESRRVGQAEEAIVKEERILPPSRLPGEKAAPAPMPTIAKVGLGLAILAGLTTVYLGFRQVIKEG